MAVTLPGPALPLAAVKQLQTGDLILLAVNRDQLPRSCRLEAGGSPRFKLRHDNNGFHIVGAFDLDQSDNSHSLREDSTMTTTESDTDRQTDSTPASSNGDAQTDYGDLPIRLHFEVGKLDVPLHDLTSVTTGYIFELDRRLDCPVTLYANGRAIGQCDLVEVENRLAARVIELFKD